MIANTVPWQGRVVVSAVVAVFALLVGVPSALGQTVPDFEDVPEGHVAEAAIEWAAQNGITQGVGDNRFGVGGTLTRYQMVTFLCRAFDPGSCLSGVRGSDSFDDVPADHWANYPIGWAVNRGITSGVSATEFGGGQTLTREQMITFLYRAEGSPTGGSDGIDVFQDAPDRSHWASLAIGWAYDQGVTGGLAEGTFGFGTNVSREEMVLFLCRTAAPATCQPSQKPLPSSVVPTSTTESEPRGTPPEIPQPRTGDDYDGISYIPFKASGYIEGVPVITERTPITGTIPVDVHYCGRQGKYTSEDLAELVRWLNDDIGSRLAAESSNLLNMVFNEGLVLSPDIAWDNVIFGEADNYCLGELFWELYQGLVPHNTPQTLIIVDAVPGFAAGYAGSTFARATSLDARRGNVNDFRGTVAHELGHTVLDLPHIFVRCGADTLMVNTQTPVAPTRVCVAEEWIGVHGEFLGKIDANLPNYGDGLLLSCYERRVLGWPVGGDSPPCVLLPPSAPSASLSSVVDDGFTVSWTPPVFTDDVPVDGYTLTVAREDSGGLNVYKRHDLSAGESSFTVDGLPVGRYSVRMWAESEYGSGVPYRTPSLPLMPSPASVTATAIDSTSIRVSWSPVPGAAHYVVWNSEDDPPDIFEIDDEGSFTFFGGTVVRGSTSLVLHNRQPDTEYTIKVRACGFQEVFGSEECSFGTEVTVTTTPPEPGATAPGAVSSVSITEAGDDWLVLSWDPVPGATFYECGYLTAQNMWFEGPGTADTSCQLWWDSRRAPPGIGLAAGNTYTVGVKACQKPLVNCTDWTTATASTQVLAAAPASYPVSVKEVGDTSFTLSWNPPAADAYYDLRVVTRLSTTFRVAGRTRDVTVPNLQPNTSYTVKVRTCRGTGGNCSSWVTIPVTTRRN